MKPIRLISRSSPLAQAQVQEFKTLVPQLLTQELWVESFGDKHQEISLWDTQSPDFFTRELDQALREDRADIALHSAKDLPCPLPDDLRVWALSPRKEPRDVLVLAPSVLAELETKFKTRKVEDFSLADLPGGTRIGTSSPSRKSQLEILRPDCPLVPIRGDIAGRLSYLAQGKADAVVVAACALIRLGWEDKIHIWLELDTHPLQGHLAAVGLASRIDLAEILGGADIRRNWGRVWILGAGPGDPQLLSSGARELIVGADVVFHDALGAPQVLGLAKRELVPVGKRRGLHEKTQDQINTLLFQAARAGKTVVRLKGGDPFIFGRGSEELDYLKLRMAEAQVVPGISSALGAAAAFGLPLTERGISRSVAFCTGWPEDQIQAPQADTLVYFMGAGSLQTLGVKNLQAGKPGQTPVALISNATLANQEIRFLTLEELSKPLGPENQLPTPVLVIIGQTARKDRPWFTPRQPGVLWYTGTDWEDLPKSRLLEPLTLFHHPLITFCPPSSPLDWTPVWEGIEAGKFHWLVLTSRQSVKAFFKALQDQGLDSRALGGIKVASVGEATARCLQGFGIRADLIPDTETAAALAQVFPPGSGGILLPCSDLAPPALTQDLEAKGWQVTRFTAYTTVDIPGPEALPPGLREIHFTSPSTVESFFRQYHLPGNVLAVCRGPSTEKALATALGRQQDQGILS